MQQITTSHSTPTFPGRFLPAGAKEDRSRERLSINWQNTSEFRRHISMRIMRMKKPKIVHVLADGSRTESILGKVVPADNPVYEIILNGQTAKGKETRTA